MVNKEIIKFGSYYQNDENKEEIEWLILDKKDSKLLLISRFAFEVKPFNDALKAITWEQSSIRKWLNDDFIKTAFSYDEYNKIQTTRVKTLDNEFSNTNGGLATNDKIFLLSKEEVEHYFPNEEDRLCIATTIAKDKAQTSTPYSWWWLRSIGSSQGVVNYINHNGQIVGHSPNCSYIGVRAAMWIDLNALKDEYVEPQKEFLELGKYYQNNLNQKDSICWRVLHKENNKALIISEYGIDIQKYNDEILSEWEDSSIKKWLNNEFINEAFTLDERDKICSDIKLLSLDEARYYFDDRNDRKCYITNYAVNKGGYKTKEGTCFYWMRSEGIGGCKMLVNGDGSINKNGIAQRLCNVIRPVMWIII